MEDIAMMQRNDGRVLENLTVDNVSDSEQVCIQYLSSRSIPTVRAALSL